MYMEAYGSVGNWADSVINKAIYGAIGKKIAGEEMAKQTEALSKQGGSLSEGEGGSPKATPNAETNPQANDINEELMASQKARKSLEKKVANWRAKAEYRGSLIKLQQKDINKYKMKEMVGVK